jgi:hypothetical protein
MKVTELSSRYFTATYGGFSEWICEAQQFIDFECKFIAFADQDCVNCVIACINCEQLLYEIVFLEMGYRYLDKQ